MTKHHISKLTTAVLPNPARPTLPYFARRLHLIARCCTIGFNFFVCFAFLFIFESNSINFIFIDGQLFVWGTSRLKTSQVNLLPSTNASNPPSQNYFLRTEEKSSLKIHTNVKVEVQNTARLSKLIHMKRNCSARLCCPNMLTSTFQLILILCPSFFPSRHQLINTFAKMFSLFIVYLF